MAQHLLAPARRQALGRRGFTIVEILVVVGITALLLGILLPALSGARKRAAKTDELNALRQVGYAWNLYANYNNGACVPGYLEPDVQTGTAGARGWKVRYDYPDHTRIPPEIAAPWTWRLFSYLDWEHSLLHDYRDEDDPSVMETIAEAEEFSKTPAFGYNAFYTGGWWEIVTVDGQQTARPRFFDARDADTGRTVPVVARTIGQIRRSSDVITFCSSTLREPGFYKVNEDNGIEGWHFVCPPYVAMEQIWARGGSSTSAVQVLASGAHPVPVNRYTESMAVLYADGHVDGQETAAIASQRSWIDAADRDDFQHTP